MSRSLSAKNSPAVRAAMESSNSDWTPPGTAGKAGNSNKAPEKSMNPSSFCSGFDEERRDVAREEGCCDLPLHDIPVIAKFIELLPPHSIGGARRRAHKN